MFRVAQLVGLMLLTSCAHANVQIPLIISHTWALPLGSTYHGETKGIIDTSNCKICGD